MTRNPGAVGTKAWNHFKRDRVVPDFVFQANIDHYKKLLAEETDPAKIATLRTLLAEEETKLASWQAAHSKPPSKQ